MKIREIVWGSITMSVPDSICCSWKKSEITRYIGFSVNHRIFCSYSSQTPVPPAHITGWSIATVFYDFSLTGFEKQKKMAKPNHFCWADIWTFWYFDVSVWSDEKKMGFSRLCQNSVTAPYCKDWEAPKRIWASPMSMNITQIPPDTHQTSPRHPPDIWRKAPTDNNRHKEAASDIQRHWQVVFECVWRCLLASVVVS